MKITPELRALCRRKFTNLLDNSILPGNTIDSILEFIEGYEPAKPLSGIEKNFEEDRIANVALDLETDSAYLKDDDDDDTAWMGKNMHNFIKD